MTNPSEVVADLRIAAEDARRFSAALFDRGYVRREGVRPFSELLERAADTIDRLTSAGEVLTWPPIIELGKTLAFYTSVIKSGESWSPECAAAYDRANKALQDLYADLGASPREGHVEVPVERPGLVRNDSAGFYEFVAADIPTFSKPFEARNVEALHDMFGSRGLVGFRVWDAALPHNQGETKP